MSDVMQIAEERRKKIASAISNHEAMIGRLREQLDALDAFVGFAEDLIEQAALKTREAQSSDVRGDRARSEAKAPDVPRIQPAQRAHSA